MDIASQIMNNNNPSAILIDSRTVVEKKQFVSTGILSHIEGDLIEIQVTPSSAFKLGEPVKMTIYSPIGMFTYLSSVIAVDSESIVVVNPPDLQKKFPERREHVRVDVNGTGIIQEVGYGLMGMKRVDPDPIHIDIRNISLGGIGFRLTEQKLELMESTVLRMELDIGTRLPCTGTVVRVDAEESLPAYGVKFLEVENSRVNTLRAFVLRVQVQQRVQNKKKASGERVFR
jgi:c-di-GMP-binding flagellar brake protein YcgR